MKVMYVVYNQFMHNFIWGHSSAGRGSDWQSEGHGFEPRYLHHILFLLKRSLFNNKTVIKMTLINLEKNNNFVILFFSDKNACKTFWS